MFLCRSSKLWGLGIPVFWEIGGWGVDKVGVVLELCARSCAAID